MLNQLVGRSGTCKRPCPLMQISSVPFHAKVEPIARVQANQLPVEQVWAGMVQGMPQGEPRPGDKGLDRTHTWDRTYWGGTMFCLVADVQIRKATGNRKGCRTLFRRSWRHKAPSIQSGRYHEFSRPVIERQGRPFSLTCIANGRMPRLWWTSINSGNSWVCEPVPAGSNWMRTHLWHRFEGP